MKKKSSAGFTLVELLVVMAIISILAAMLLPVLARTVESARQTACTSNMKQIFLGLASYADEFNGTVPPTFFRWEGPPGSWNHTKWPDVLVYMDYIEVPMFRDNGNPITIPGYCPISRNEASPGVFRCPSWENYKLEPNLTETKGYGPVQEYFEFDLMQNIPAYPPNTRRFGRPRKLDALPSDTPMLTEGSTTRIQINHPYNSWDAVLFRHDSRADILYVGGHVRLCAPYQW